MCEWNTLLLICPIMGHYNGEAHPGETALLMKGDHRPAWCFFPLNNSIRFMALNEAVKGSHVVYADGKC